MAQILTKDEVIQYTIAKTNHSTHVRHILDSVQSKKIYGT